nr:MAG TPA: hypothetical protein [Caudoviricetes sp.]
MQLAAICWHNKMSQPWKRGIQLIWLARPRS